MATQIICDGCQKPTDKAWVLGVVVKRDYCDECLPAVEAYLAERDVLHDKAASSWQKGLARLKAAAKKDRPGLELPDD